MQVSLEAIKFNLGLHDQGIGALPIRINETQSVTLPEWRRGGCLSPECAPAAYVRTRPQTPIMIQAKFSSTDLKGQEVEIQAVAPSDDVLGRVKKAVVRFDEKGQSEFVSFTVPSPQFFEVGVSASTTKWEWQVLSKSGKWLPFQDTSHRIYCLLAQPREPWFENLPWTEVLEVTCEWAKGAQEVDPAATLITQQVFDLGKTQVLYSRSPAYANRNFDCTAFLSLLRDKVPEPRKVNCDDCATIVSTFANILGCDLSQSGMKGTFTTKFIRKLGSTKWQDKIGFPRHAVAWKDKCEATDEVFDACFGLDANDRPDMRDHVLMVAKNLIFGDEGNEDSYKFRLFSKGKCEPNPGFERCRRPLGQSYFGSRRFYSQEYLSLLKNHYEFESWPDSGRVTLRNGAILEIPGRLENKSAFTGFSVRSKRVTTDKDLNVVLDILISPPDFLSQRLAGISVYECAAETTSSDFLLQLLGQFHTLDLTSTVERIGDLSFQEADGIAVLFKHAQFVVAVRSLGWKDFSTLEIAEGINLILTSMK